MYRLIGLVLFSQFAIFTLAQSTSQPVPTSDPQAVALAQKSMAALTGGTPITDVTISANVTSLLGSDNQTGTGTFQVKGVNESRIVLNLSETTVTEVRSFGNGAPKGAWTKNGGTPIPQAGHNTITDSAWFFPALSCLTQFPSSSYVFKYVGQEQHNDANTQHIQVSLLSAVPNVARLSTTDFYLDPLSYLPVAVAFKTHPDEDMNRDIPVEILFANYQPVNGTQVPFHFQKMLNGGVVLDVVVTSAVFNTGLLDSSFTLQ